MRPPERPLPDAISEEKINHGLAGLCRTAELEFLLESVVGQWKNTAVFEKLARHNIFPIRQVLLYGPPGNGKTTACQFMASEINVPLYRVRCESLVTSQLGGTPRIMRECMDWLARAGKCVVLFDEVETIFPSRERGRGGACEREIASSMTVFWQALDRWTTPQLFCFATNLPEQLDRALVSRCEVKLEFGPPTQDQVRSVVAYWSEVFHEYQPETWKDELAEAKYESYRDLWQRIAYTVRRAALA